MYQKETALTKLAKQKEYEIVSGGGGGRKRGGGWGRWREVKTKSIDTKQGCKRYIKQTRNPFS